MRPIDESIVRNVAETAAVTLMRGAAHWRGGDVDVATCRRHGIAVAGLDEEAVGLYRYPPLGVLAALLDLGVEVAGSTVVVAGDGPSCAYVVQALARLGARVLVAAPETAGRIGLYGGEKAGDALGDDGRRRPPARGGRPGALPGRRRASAGSARARPRTRRASRRPRRTSPWWAWTPRATCGRSAPPACAAGRPAAPAASSTCCRRP